MIKQEAKTDVRRRTHGEMKCKARVEWSSITWHHTGRTDARLLLLPAVDGWATTESAAPVDVDSTANDADDDAETGGHDDSGDDGDPPVCCSGSRPCRSPRSFEMTPMRRSASFEMAATSTAGLPGDGSGPPTAAADAGAQPVAALLL